MKISQLRVGWFFIKIISRKLFSSFSYNKSLQTCRVYVFGLFICYVRPWLVVIALHFRQYIVLVKPCLGNRKCISELTVFCGVLLL